MGETKRKMRVADPDGERCRCGGELEPCNFFPIELLEHARTLGVACGTECVAFFGCGKCGEWTMLPAAKLPLGTHLQRGAQG